MRKTDGNLAVANKNRHVLTIQATERADKAKERIGIYTRVSSPSEDQLNSFAAQERRYRQLVATRADWELVDLYADEGISGTDMAKRDDFLRLLSDCKRGKIDLIVVKSVSRFARNTKEFLTVIRELKSLGVGVYFEEQNIDTRVATGEMMTTIFASIAQAESESISQNMRWSYKRRMEQGKFVTCKAPFGYRMNAGTLEVNKDEATVVIEIFTRYLQGHSCAAITSWINTLGIKSRDGNDTWRVSAVRYILRNEKYIGNALLQKKYSTDSFPFKKVENKGAKAKYYVESTQTAIISREVFEAAQKLLKQRGEKIISNPAEGNYLSGRVICGNCGESFKRKRHQKDVYWVCRTHDQDKNKCDISQLAESEIQKAFLRLYFKLKKTNAGVLRIMLQTLEKVREKRYLYSPEVMEINNQIADVQSQNHTLAMLNQQGLVDPDFYLSQCDALAEQLRALKSKREELMGSDDDDAIAETKSMILAIQGGPDFMPEFDPKMFSELVEKIIVDSNEEIHIRLINGMELREKIERKKR